MDQAEWKLFYTVAWTFVQRMWSATNETTWSWFPEPFFDETFEAFEGPRVEGGGGQEGAPKPSKASKVRTNSKGASVTRICVHTTCETAFWPRQLGCGREISTLLERK